MNVVGDATKARFIATFIDTWIAIGITFVAVAMVPSTMPVLRGIVLVAVYLGYFVVLEGIWSRTLGKYFQGLVVRKLDGGKCGWKSSLIRTVFRIVEVNPLMFGGIPAGLVVISTDRKQRLGDILANTIVVPEKLEWDQADVDSTVAAS